MTDDQLEQIFADWSVTRPDLILNAWDAVTFREAVKWALMKGHLHSGSVYLAQLRHD